MGISKDCPCWAVEKVRSSLFNKIFGNHKTFGPVSDSFTDKRGMERLSSCGGLWSYLPAKPPCGLMET
jgi:hypothetical protein